MKPAPFEYFAPEKIDDVVELLSRHGEDGKILAGGQSLMPLMNLRLARPQVIIDINRVTALDYISQRADGELAIGALTRQRSLEQSPIVKIAILYSPPPYRSSVTFRSATAARLVEAWSMRTRQPSCLPSAWLLGQSLS
jgi:hypothetical protein